MKEVHTDSEDNSTQVKRKRWNGNPRKDSISLNKIFSYSVSEHLNLSLLFEQLDFMIPSLTHKKIVSEVLCGTTNSGRSAFFFEFGVVVFWGFNDQDLSHLIQNIFFYCLRQESKEYEELEFGYSSKFRVSKDMIYLSGDKMMEKLAVSYAVAQSVQLGIHEDKIEATIKSTSHLQEELATKGRTTLSKTQITKKIGQLFLQRAQINLKGELLDTPDCFWDYEEWEGIYKQMRKYLDLDPRIEILNQRLGIIKELLSIFNEEFTKRHGHSLEWIVIVLIFIEVFIDLIWQVLLRDILKLNQV